jgi:hypothetical protein
MNPILVASQEAGTNKMAFFLSWYSLILGLATRGPKLC